MCFQRVLIVHYLQSVERVLVKQTHYMFYNWYNLKVCLSAALSQEAVSKAQTSLRNILLVLLSRQWVCWCRNSNVAQFLYCMNFSIFPFLGQ